MFVGVCCKQGVFGRKRDADLDVDAGDHVARGAGRASHGQTMNSLGQPPEPVEHLHEEGRAVRPRLDLANAKVQLVQRAAGGH